MLALVTTLMLAAPSAGLVVSEFGKPTASLGALLEPIETGLATTLAVQRLSAKCDGQRECVVNAGKTAAVDAVIAVTIAWNKRQTIDLEVIRLRDGATLAQLTFTVAGKLLDGDRANVRAMAVQVAPALATQVVSDVPVRETEPVPVVPADVKPADALAVTRAREAKSTTPGWVLVGTGVGAGIAAGVLVGVATSQRAVVEQGDPSSVTRPQARALADQANGEFTAALVCSLAAGALLTAGLVWLVTD